MPPPRSARSARRSSAIWRICDARLEPADPRFADRAQRQAAARAADPRSARSREAGARGAHRAQLCFARARERSPASPATRCRWFLAGNHPDFRRVESEAVAKVPPPADRDEEAPTSKRATKQPSIEIKVDQVRELADFLYVRSHRGGVRLALVHPAEDMNENAANALLKGLEEPPAGAMFILVSHRPAQLLPTIRSRCVAVPVPIPPREAALQWLVSPRRQRRGALAGLCRRRAAARRRLRRRRRSPVEPDQGAGAGGGSRRSRAARRGAAENRPGPRALRFRAAAQVPDRFRRRGAGESPRMARFRAPHG